MKNLPRAISITAFSLVLAGCSNMEPLQAVDHVDIDRFMGDWYVIANIPTSIEKGAHNAIESYRLDYRIIYLDNDYSVTVIGRNKRDYVWIMAREPAIPAPEYAEILGMLETAGYDPGEIQLVPQKW